MIWVPVFIMSKRPSAIFEGVVGVGRGRIDNFLWELGFGSGVEDRVEGVGERGSDVLLLRDMMMCGFLFMKPPVLKVLMA